MAATARGVAARCRRRRIRAGPTRARGARPSRGSARSVEEALATRRRRTGARRVLVVPVGFVCDHTEILFDIDVQAAQAARRLGIEVARTESLNTSPTFIRALADLVRRGT